MNNVDYKNIVLGLTKNDSLPYKETGHVKYTSDTSINSGTVNNTFGQFVDNDRFIENYLQGTQSYQYGPKSDEQDRIYYGDDGYKYFKDEGGHLAIYRKIEKDLNSDISRKIGGDANFLFKHGGFYLCGMDSSLRYSKDLETWSTVNLRNVKGYYSTEYQTVIAAKDGVYFVTFDVNEITVDRMNETELQECKSVLVSDNNYIYVGCADGIYRAYYGGYSTGNRISFEKLELRNEEGEKTTSREIPVNDIIQFDDSIYLAAEDNVYVDANENTLKGYEFWLEDQTVNCVVKLGEYTFVGTNENLYGKYDESDQFYALFPSETRVYSGVSYKDSGYFGTISGILSVELRDGILEPIDEYPFISELSNVKTLKMYRVNKKNRLYGIDGVSCFFMEPDTGNEVQILTADDPTDIHVVKDDVYVSTKSGLTKAIVEGTEQQLETYETIERDNERAIAIRGIVTGGGKTYAYGEDTIFNIDNINLQLKTDHINTAIHVDSFGARRNVVLVFTSRGTEWWNADENGHGSVDNDDRILSIVEYDGYFFAIVLDNAKYALKKYDQNLVFQKQFQLQNSDDPGQLFIDGGYLYVFQTGESSNGLRRYRIAEGETYGSFDENCSSVKGIFDNGTNGLLVAKSNRIQYSELASDAAGMTDMKDVIASPINKIEHFGTIFDDDSNAYDRYYLYTANGVSSLDFGVDSNGKADFSDKSLDEICRETDIRSYGLLGSNRVLLQGQNTLLVKDYDFSDLSVSLTSESLFSRSGVEDVFYNAEDPEPSETTMIVKTSDGNVFSRIGMGTVRQVTGFPDGEIGNIRKFSTLDDWFIVFTTRGIYKVSNGTATSIGTNQTLLDTVEEVSYDTVVHVTYRNTTVSYDDKLLFGLGNQVYAVYFTGDNAVVGQYISNANVGTGNVIGISQSLFHGSGIYFWVFFKDKAIEYVIPKGGDDYSQRPSATGRVKVFYQSIRRGFVSDIITNEGSYEADFVVLTENGDVLTTSTYSNQNGSVVMGNASGLIQRSTFYDGMDESGKDVIGETMLNLNSFYIMTDNHVLYRYQDGGLVVVKSYGSEPSIFYTGCTQNFVEKTSQGYLNLVSFDSDREYRVSTTFSRIDDMVQAGDGLAFLIGGKVHYSKQTNYLDFKGTSIIELASTGTFRNSGILRIVPYENKLLAFSDTTEYKLTISFASASVLDCEAKDLSDIDENLDLENVIVYGNRVEYNDKSYDLLGELHGVQRTGDILYCGSDKTWFVNGNEGTTLVNNEAYHNDTISRVSHGDSGTTVLVDDGIHVFQNGSVGDLMEVHGHTITGDVEDFVYCHGECFFKTGDKWYKKLSSGDDYQIQVQDDILWYYVNNKQKERIVCGDGVYEITHDTATRIENTETERLLVGRSIEKVYGSSNSLTLVMSESDGKTVRKFSSTTGSLSDPVKYTLDVVDEDEETTPQEIDVFENIAFLDINGMAIASYGDKTYIRTGNHGSFSWVPIEIPQVNRVVKTDKTCLCTTDGLVRFDSYGNLYYFANAHNSLNPVRYNKFVCHDGILYACSQQGIYKIVNGVPIKISYSAGNNEIGSFLVDSGTGKFLVPELNCVYETDNIRILTEAKFSIDGVDWIKQVFRKDSKNYLFVTNDGLYKTNYQYEISDDIQKFSVQDAIGVYESMKEQLERYYTTWYNTHIAQYHKAGSNVDLLANGYVDVDFDGIDENWQNDEICQDYIAIDNDIVFEIESSTDEDGDIYASASNVDQTLSGLAIEDIPLTYILKRWKSGNCELYVYLTTTNTYYLPFNRGVPDCEVDESEKIERTNLVGVTTVSQDQRKQSSKIDEHYTNIELDILSSFCFMDCIQDIQINGNSMPLKVYKDRDQRVGTTSQNLYQSFIEPSVVDSCDISQTDAHGAYNFRFKCFGSDSQAIRIQFYDSRHKYGTNSYTIVFDSNGGTGTMKKQRVAEGQQVDLRKNRFTKRVSGVTRTFLGWSLTKQADNTQPTFTDQGAFSSELAGVSVENGGTITLYAVWLAYNFENGNSTQIALASNRKEFIVKEAQTFTDDQIGDRVIIDFGE